MKIYEIVFLIILSIAILTAIVFSKRPKVEPFEDISISSLADAATTDVMEAKNLQDEASKAIEKCKVMGINLPQENHTSESVFTFKMSPSCSSETSIPTIRKLVKDTLSVSIPYFVSTQNAQEIERAKVTLAKAYAAQAQANASTALVETAKKRLQMKGIEITETAKQNPEVQAAEATAQTKLKQAEAAKKESERLEKIAQEKKQREADELKRAMAQKDAADAKLLAAKADAEAGSANAAVTETIMKVEKSTDAKKQLETILEADKKTVEALNALVTAAEAKAEVAQAQVNVVAAEKPTSEESSKSDRAVVLAAEEQLRKKLEASQIADAEAGRKRQEEIEKYEAAQAKLKRDSAEREERRLYATDVLNRLLQGGILQTNSDGYSRILNAQTKAEIDSLASQITNQVQEERNQRIADQELFNRRLNELNEARQGRAILTPEEERKILTLQNEGEFQLKKQAIKTQVDQLIQKQKEEQQKKIDEMNRIQAEKEKQRLAELMAMSPVDRAKSQLDEAKAKEDSLRGQASEKLENYKKRILGNLVNVDRVISLDTATKLSSLPTYEEFDRQLRIERMKNETPEQKSKREKEETEFAEYKIEDTNNMLKADVIFSDADTLARLRNATNYDMYKDLVEIEIQRKRQNYFSAQVADATTAQSQAIFAQNMEPSRAQMVEEANKNGYLTSEQYARLKVTSINTPEKFKAVEDEIQRAGRDYREKESQRIIAAAEAERKAREESDRKKREEDERLAQEDFLRRRAQDVEIISTGMFAITPAQKQDLLTTNDRTEFNQKKEQYILQAYGGTRKQGESLADFFNRRRDEVIAEQALAESRRRDEQQKADRIAYLFRTNEENLNSNNRFWIAEARENLRILNIIKAKNLSNTDFLKEWEEMTMSDSDRKKKEDERKFDETQKKVFQTKDPDGFDINFYRLFKYTMPAQYAIKDKTAQECVDEVAKNPNAGGFLREAGKTNDEKADCWVNEWGMQFAKPTDSALNVYARYNQLKVIPEADSVVGSQAFSEATQIDANISAKRAELEAKRLEDEKRAQKAALDSASEIFTYNGKNYLAFKGYRFNNDEGRMENVVSALGANWDPSLEETVSQVASKGAKSFARNVRKWPADLGWDVSRNRALSILYSDSNPYNLSATFDPRFVTYIPVENLPSEFRVSGFTNYSPNYGRLRYIHNQNNFMERTSRTQNYTFFHPAL